MYAKSEEHTHWNTLDTLDTRSRQKQRSQPISSPDVSISQKDHNGIPFWTMPYQCIGYIVLTYILKSWMDTYMCMRFILIGIHWIHWISFVVPDNVMKHTWVVKDHQNQQFSKSVHCKHYRLIDVNQICIDLYRHYSKPLIP